MISQYIREQLLDRVAKMPELREELIKEAEQMSGIGIDSADDHKNFFYIMRHANFFANALSSHHNFSSEELAKFASIIYANKKDFPINTIFNFYKAAENALNKMNISIKKTAYPQGEFDSEMVNPHNLQKWMEAMREIYAFAKRSSVDVSKAFEIVTEKWDKMERQDFKYWMSFYQENAHNKYKTAQQDKYYTAGPGAIIPFDHLRSKLPTGPDMRQFDAVDDEVRRKQEMQAQKESIRKKIRSIISRLNAAERLATDPEVQRDLQQCIDIGVPKWLEELQRVKRLVQLAPMRSSSSSILEDLIIKQANILRHNGFPMAAQEMAKFAQPASGSSAPIDPMSAALPPSENGMGNDGKEAIDELIEGMNADVADVNESEDTEDDPLAAITVIAQAVPEEPQVDSAVAPVNLEVTEEDPGPAKTIMDPKTDDLFEAALSNVTMHDIIVRLETLANIFRTREIPRQLAIIDILMDRLSISAYFPSLAEASSKSLESNQYALTRIEDILSKLRGSVETPKERELDLVGRGIPSKPVPQEINPEAVRENLAKQDETDKARKERRQAEEDAKATQVLQQPAEVTNVPEELAQPAKVVPTAPVR